MRIHIELTKNEFNQIQKATEEFNDNLEEFIKDALMTKVWAIQLMQKRREKWKEVLKSGCGISKKKMDGTPIISHT